MAIPARDIRHVLTAHGLELQYNILEDFIECGANVNVAVCKRRTVVQYKSFLGLCVASPEFLMNTLGVPLFELLGFTLHQPGFHGKTGLR